MTTKNVLDWINEAERNNIWEVGTQNVKRHLEEVIKTDNENKIIKCCEPVDQDFYLGTSCPKCMQPFRQNLK